MVSKISIIFFLIARVAIFVAIIIEVLRGGRLTGLIWRVVD